MQRMGRNNGRALWPRYNCRYCRSHTSPIPARSTHPNWHPSRCVRMPIRFACTNCRQPLAIGSRKAGSQIICPKCQAEVTVPSENVPVPPPVIQQHVASEPTPSPPPPPRSIQEIPSFSSLSIEVDPPASQRPNEPNFAELLGFDDVSAAVETPLMPDAPPIEYERSPDRKTVTSDHALITVSRKVLYAQAFLITLVAILSFWIGYLSGAGSRPAESKEAPGSRSLEESTSPAN
jgi:hypothetical protein